MIKMTQEYLGKPIIVTVEGDHWEVEHPLLHYKCTGTFPYSAVMDTVNRLKKDITEKMNKGKNIEKSVYTELAGNGFVLLQERL